MQRLILATVLFTLVLSGLPAQDQPDFNTLNAQSYRLYLEGDWDSVIVIGRQALEREMDFYYLRMRMGIAYYQKKNYRKAERHFRRALELNQGEPAALEQLYYAQLMAGKSELARITRSGFKGEVALRLPPGKPRLGDRISASYFYQNALTEDGEGGPAGTFPVNPSGVQHLARTFSNYNLKLVNSMKPGLSLSHSFNYLRKTNFYYYSNGILGAIDEEQEVRQFQYYLSPAITSGSGFIFSPMIHLVRISYEAPLTIRQGVQGGRETLDMETRVENDLVAGLSLSKGAGLVDLHGGFWYSNLNMAKQFQARAGLTFFPLGNLKLYGGAFINAQYEYSGRDSTLRFIPELMTGFSLADRAWIDLRASAGEMSQYLEQNGALVYNSFSDVILRKAELTLSLPVSGKGSLFFLGGRWSLHESKYYPTEEAEGAEINKIQYQSISFYGGLSWKF